VNSLFSRFHSLILAKPASALVLTALAAAAIAAEPFQAGDILYTDSFGAVFKITPATGERTTVASGDKLVQPFGIALDADGHVLVSDTGALAIIRIDSRTGAQSILSRGGRLGVPYGLAVEQNGDIVVANSQAILRVNPRTGEPTIVSEGDGFGPSGGYPLGVAVADDGDLIVVTGGQSGEVIRVDPKNGQQKRLSREGALKSPQALALNGDDIYVTDLATGDGNFGVGRVLHFDPRTGRPKEVSLGESLVGPVGIAVESDGRLVVADPYTKNPESRDLYDGGIIRINPQGGRQTLLARGSGNYVNPRGIVVIPAVRPNSR
jgi:streptogramin lyase